MLGALARLDSYHDVVDARVSADLLRQRSPFNNTAG